MAVHVRPRHIPRAVGRPGQAERLEDARSQLLCERAAGDGLGDETEEEVVRARVRVPLARREGRRMLDGDPDELPRVQACAGSCA